ncbi:LysR family transcriptional regulator [Vibrio europaeus]|jgi:DNA-binding transcriptional LysR family regulator|uniref:Transcriptional regulator n=3 Tax=Vibrio oreintalis group TaxID=1891919 RepID=F9T3Z1_9VIBR|nr:MULTISPECIES: LysR family transcriptional regulator [Vibrio]AIW17144.1 transcriptional regulator [Vibrio tubiashii ATCC 19109]EGU56506.1 transcriptional regulator [Vibrio tubiashii ATCC 19109]KLN66021.1 transcriptional regulator [Vibrio sp. VPAP30]MCG9583650.1 LysR family transcriptional regulator [Vibrio tubiashii]MCG9617227.1 LysR family transcriptional regulator [Vibrio tubiashii]
MMNNELISFAAVCKHLSITKAANELGKSKAHISRHIADLEASIGVKLLYRTTRNISLTPKGESLKETALELLANLNELSYKTSTMNDEMSGKFTITMPSSIAASLFIDILKKLKCSFPNVSFRIIATNKVENLIEGNIDMAIRIGSIRDESLIAHNIGTFSNILVSSKKSRGDTLIVYEKFRHKETVANNYNGTIEVDNVPLLITFLENGIGVGIVPDYYFKANSMCDVTILEKYQDCHNIYITYPFQSPLPKNLLEISAIITSEMKRILHIQL